MATITLDEHGFNFVDRFPVPRDEQLNDAGRQGLLDQKEDPDMSDADWIAAQHAAWAGELVGVEVGIAYLDKCLIRGIDPATGHAPRRAHRQQTLAETLRIERRQLQGHRAGVLGDYADHFGEAAANAFAAFVAACAQDAQADEGQGELFD